jgi:sugar phosphate isomerase/epimerase
MRDGAITYDVARYNIDHRFPGTIPLERWCYVRECLREVSKMAEDAGVVLALQNHKPVIENYRDMLAFIEEVDSPALKACLDPPLMAYNTEEFYRQALEETGDLMVHSHYGGRFVEKDGRVERVLSGIRKSGSDWPTFLKLAKEIIDFKGHIGYELCSPVLCGHKHTGQAYALKQAELAAKWMRQCMDEAGVS